MAGQHGPPSDLRVDKRQPLHGAGLGNQQNKAAHAALQGRTTSTFEACHLLLAFPIVEFSRENEWIQVGPPETWTLSVPKYEESRALQRPDSYRRSKLDRDGYMPAAQRWHREMQKAFSEQEVDIPVEGGMPTTYRNFPDQEPEAFYYSRLMLYTVWEDPGDWLRDEDNGSHAAALAQDVGGHPDFLGRSASHKWTEP